jgi:hypothetical protein
LYRSGFIPQRGGGVQPVGTRVSEIGSHIPTIGSHVSSAARNIPLITGGVSSSCRQIARLARPIPAGRGIVAVLAVRIVLVRMVFADHSPRFQSVS